MTDYPLHLDNCASKAHKLFKCDCVYAAIRRIAKEPLPPNAPGDIARIVTRARAVNDIDNYLQQRSSTSITRVDQLLLAVDIIAAISLVGIRPEKMLELIIRVYPHHADEILDILLNQS